MEDTVMYTSLKSTFSAIVGYNSVGAMVRLAVVASQICEILRKFELMECKGIQGHRSWCQSKAHMQLPVSHQ